MPRMLFESDIPLINEFISRPEVRPFINPDQDYKVEDVHNTVFYMSDDNKDLVAFDRIDRRIHFGHNAMTNKIRQAINNGRDIIDLHFKLYPDLEIIAGLTPWNLKATRLFNNKMGFKLVGLQYNLNNVLCYRYELRRNTWHSK